MSNPLSFREGPGPGGGGGGGGGAGKAPHYPQNWFVPLHAVSKKDAMEN